MRGREHFRKMMILATVVLVAGAPLAALGAATRAEVRRGEEKGRGEKDHGEAQVLPGGGAGRRPRRRQLPRHRRDEIHAVDRQGRGERGLRHYG
jgi:hypothetical protein